MKKRLHRCCKCNNVATWYYMPGNKKFCFFCDEHVPRGCFCQTYCAETDGLPKSDNIIWLNEEHTIYEYLDNKGRRYPCCEYDYDENGQEFFEKQNFIKKIDIINIWIKSREKLKNHVLYNNIKNFIENTKDELIFYNSFMHSVREMCDPFMRHLILNKEKDVVDFYNSFRSQCYQNKIKIWK